MAEPDLVVGAVVVGAVLTGGSSARMGRDKATIVVEGETMAVRVGRALQSAGADRVAAIGIPVDRLEPVPDRYPGQGPLGGVLTALAWAGDSTVLVAPCDLLAPAAAALAALLAGLEASGALVAVPSLDAPLPLALRPRAMAALLVAFEAGERSLRGALRRLPAAQVAVVVVDAASLADADGPEDLPPGAR